MQPDVLNDLAKAKRRWTEKKHEELTSWLGARWAEGIPTSGYSSWSPQVLGHLPQEPQVWCSTLDTAVFLLAPQRHPSEQLKKGSVWGHHIWTRWFSATLLGVHEHRETAFLLSGLRRSECFARTGLACWSWTFWRARRLRFFLALAVLGGEGWWDRTSSLLGRRRGGACRRLLELVQFRPRASIIPQLSVVGEHFQESCREGAELLPLIRAPRWIDQRVRCQEQSKVTVLTPPLFQFGQVFERAGLEGELTNVEGLQGDEERVKLIHDLALWTGGHGLVDRHHSQQIFPVLGKPGLLSDLLVACPYLTHLVEVNKTMGKMISLDSLNELAVRLTMDWKNNVRVPGDERLSKFGMVFTRDLRHLWRIFFHLFALRAAKWSRIVEHVFQTAASEVRDFLSRLIGSELGVIRHQSLDRLLNHGYGISSDAPGFAAAGAQARRQLHRPCDRPSFKRSLKLLLEKEKLAEHAKWTHDRNKCHNLQNTHAAKAQDDPGVRTAVKHLDATSGIARSACSPTGKCSSEQPSRVSEADMGTTNFPSSSFRPLCAMPRRTGLHPWG